MPRHDTPSPQPTPSLMRQAGSAVLWVIPGVYFVFVAAEFGLMTHLALRATAEGRSALAVGALSSAMWAGILLASVAAHAVVAPLGHARVFIAATGLAFVATGSAALHTHFAGWLAGAFVLGLGGGLVWVAGEAWLAEAAPPERRGFFVGLFETAVGLGLMVGPALVPLTGWAGIATPVACATLMFGAVLASLLLRGIDEPGNPAHEAAGTAAAVPPWRALALPLCGIAVISGLMESGVSALLPSISMRLGSTLEAAAWLGAAIGAGSALMQPPAGLLADRFGTHRITCAAWLVLVLANGLLLATASDPGAVLWIVGFTLGGVGGAIYTLMIVELGHRLAGGALVRAIGLLVTAYALGTAVGPTLGGLVFDTGGLTALATALLGVAAAGLGVSVRTRGLGQHAAL